MRAPPPTDTVPASRWTRYPAELSAGLCPSCSKPRGIEGSRKPCVGGQFLRALPRPTTTRLADRCDQLHSFFQNLRIIERWPPCGSPRAGCLLSRPQRRALRALFALVRRILGGLLAPREQLYACRVQGCSLPVDLLGLAQPIQEDSVQLFPHARFVPFLEPKPTRHIPEPRIPSLLRQHLPGYAALEDEQDASEGCCAVVDAWSGRLWAWVALRAAAARSLPTVHR